MRGALRPQDIIRKKRDREQLLPAEINFFIDGVTHGQIADYQISALLMAIYLNGMNEAEQQCADRGDAAIRQHPGFLQHCKTES